MKMQYIAVAVTFVNFVLLIVLLTKINPAAAQPRENDLQVIRGSGLEITDKTGKLRASITFHDSTKQDGVTYPAGILLRLIDSKGQPCVKIDASENGGGLSFSNEAQGYLQLMSKEEGGFLKIKNADGKEQVFKP